MSAAILSAALLLDAAVGEPRWLWSRLPHPAVLMGRAVRWCDERYNQGYDPRPGGIKTVLILLAGAIVLGWFLSLIGPLVECVVAAILLAQRSLVQHVQAVADALRLSVEDGRMMVTRIVSRETSQMETPDIARAAIESAAENLSDGVVAPAFWFLIGGLPGILAYKVINTADSMIGYRTAKYEEFGWAAARLDDVLNWIPARLTALLIAVTSRLFTSWGAIRDDARLHRSPNAGWPEAAMARVLGVALAGPRVYDGERRELPFVFEDGAHDIGPDAIDRAVKALWRAWGAMLAATVVIALF
ncbi:adenosylcobinamide-phosphate synthase CbiB [Aestuariivita boseongensis]|uniref:adenosylcobinamide-phosphate synthase CbiB n=1 Tax=Aestuariivita boseongensis TaxID=1470562 RepID=UPI0006831019|nr:adenosylcobinamide-phosphate synthase CbiB [Aestuariivita boseongensis]